LHIPDDIKPLRTGDLLLITGEFSQSLINAQKLFIPTTESSHIALVHAETLCIDANPRLGVQNRFLLDLVNSTKTNWRAIRKRSLTSHEKERLLVAAPYFLFQSYLIHPSEKIGKSKSYCSELARKVFHRANVEISVPESGLVMPGHFDLLQQQCEQWEDITVAAREWVAFVEQNEEELRGHTGSIIKGLKLNRRRFLDRDDLRKKLKKDKKNLSPDGYAKAKEILHQIDRDVKFKFWDV
jgi:hypothetical protein